jgi:hypothetical protein
MENLTLIIPAKFESEALPKVLKELQLYKNDFILRSATF